MDLQHSFTVPADVDTAWATLLDLEGVAPCFPGATLTGVEGEEFTGQVKVKLGPVSLQYTGKGRFVERDDGTHRAVIEAQGRDRRGNGTAGATVVAQLASEGDALTRVTVDTSLKVTGRPAQFGRSVMQDVGARIVDQFAESLARRLAGDGTAPPAAAAAAAGEAAPVGEAAAPVGETAAPVGETAAPVGEAAAPVGETAAPVGEAAAPVGEAAAPVGEAASAAGPKDDDAAATSAIPVPAAEPPQVRSPRPPAPRPAPVIPGPETGAAKEPVTNGAPARWSTASASAASVPRENAPVAKDELDLNAVVLPVLARRYGPTAVAVLLTAVVTWLVARRRR